MAGGEGKDFTPYSNFTKALIPYKGKSLAEHIISRFKGYGLENFILTIKYKGNLMKAYFSNLINDKISFIYETKSLGTAGSLYKLIKKKCQNFFVINCDTMIRCDYISYLIII